MGYPTLVLTLYNSCSGKIKSQSFPHTTFRAPSTNFIQQTVRIFDSIDYQIYIFFLSILAIVTILNLISPIFNPIYLALNTIQGYFIK